jgi:hypothetical protein
MAKDEQASGEYKCRPEIKLLEYDERFAVFKEFVRYDFEKAIQLPPEMKASFDHIICDPPFLSEDCQTKGMNDLMEVQERQLLNQNSCFNGSMASQILVTRISTSYCLYGRAYGELSDHQAIWKDWYQDH